MKTLEELVRKEKIDCDLTFTRSLDIYLDANQLAAAKSFYDYLVDQGLDFMDDVKYLSQEDAQGVSIPAERSIIYFLTDTTLDQKAKVRNAQGGFSFSAGHLWPYKLVCGLIRIAVSRGLDLQTNTMVTEIGQNRTPEGLWPVTTDRGVIYARKIILATNAFTSALAPEYSKAIVPCKGLCTHIEAAAGAPFQELPETYAIRQGPGAFIYQISRKDGSIIVGGAQYTYRDIPHQWHNNPDDGTLIQTVEHYFDGYMQRTFHGWEDSNATVKRIWTGGEHTLSVLLVSYSCLVAMLTTRELLSQSWPTVQTHCHILEMSRESQGSLLPQDSTDTECRWFSCVEKLSRKWLRNRFLSGRLAYPNSLRHLLHDWIRSTMIL